MTDEIAPWKWMGGILHGFGDACWEERDGKIRRITKCAGRHPSGVGILLSKAMFVDMIEMGHENVYDAEKLVIVGYPLIKKNATDLAAMWSNLVIGNGNGAQPTGPRIIR